VFGNESFATGKLNFSVAFKMIVTLKVHMWVILSKMCYINRLRVFENRLLKRIFGPKRDKVTGKRRRLHKKELYALYSSPNIILGIKSKLR
jgi:hypothetical protein